LYLSGVDFERSIRRSTPTVERAETILQNVAAFRDLAAKHQGTIQQFLEELDPLIDAADADPPAEPHVRITSIHKSKGEQWPVVFVPGLANGAFPSMFAESDDDEAERRLFYVAMTRAVERLYLVHPADAAFSKHAEQLDEEVARPPDSPTSPFLWEMHLALARHAGESLNQRGPFTSRKVDAPDIANAYFQRFDWARDWRYDQRERAEPARADALTPDPSRLSTGTPVEHPVFGNGVVDAWLDERVVRIRFDNGDTRLFVAELTPLRVLTDRSIT
jgi:DNA helicase-2/ATP-dependent DNA helicase PcrA